MSKRELRGTKRTCQNGTCGIRFYDLMRDPIVCPSCSAAYQIMAIPATSGRDERSRRAKKPEYVAAPAVVPVEAPEVEGEVALADLPAEDEAVPAADDETFLEEEEDEGSDVTGIIGGAGEGEEET